MEVPIFAGLRRTFGEPERAKAAASPQADAVGDQGGGQPVQPQPSAATLPLASPALPTPSASSTLPIAHAEPIRIGPGGPGDVTVPQEVVDRPDDLGQVVRRIGGLVIALARKGQACAGWTIRLAADRAVAPNSVTGVSMLLACCAAAWFSGGTSQDDALGLIATGAWVLARLGARQLATVNAQRADPPAAEPATQSDGQVRGAGFGWLYAVCATAAECVIYCGITVGAEADGWTTMWPLALACVIVGSVAALARAIGLAVSSQDGQRTRPVWSRWVGLRVLIAALITVGYGPRVALFAVLATETISLVRGVITASTRMSAAQPASRASLAGQGLLLMYRDDGPLARRAGWLVRGNLMPVPSAIAGVIAIGLLAVLGMKNLPGIVALTPVVVLLLAAPGSSHPHDGRFDWLAPLLLCTGQYSYLAALGAAKSVSWLIIYAACAMTAVWYTSLIASPAAAAAAQVLRSRNARINRIMAMRPDSIGWEGRVIGVGLSGIFGMAMFGYLGLAVYLGALTLRKVAIGYLMPGEDERR